MKFVNIKRLVLITMLTATFGTFGSMVGFVDNPYTTTTAQAATAGNDGAGRYWVKNMVMHTTGKEMNSWQGRLSSVLGKARKVTISKYGKVQANKKYKVVYDTYSYPRSLWSRSGGVSNVRVYRQ
ncbi:hypothetical protein [Lactiplantibacillus plantarum]|uniref:hypothetical protein n=1 Tax=Lactiplantibacillus plantarum TaxID=1590 RepID=UPI003F52C62C